MRPESSLGSRLRFSAVVFEEPAQPLMTAVVGRRQFLAWLSSPSAVSLGKQDLVFSAVVGSFGQVEFLEGRLYAVEMPSPKEDEVVQAFAAQGADEAFHERLEFGDLTGVFTIFTRRRRRTLSNSGVNFVSRSCCR